MDSTAEAYSNEPVRYPALQVIDLAAEGAAITDSYRNIVINQVNGSCLRLAQKKLIGFDVWRLTLPVVENFG